MELSEHKGLFTIDDYFLILKKKSFVHKNERSREDIKPYVSWKTDEWHLGKLKEAVYQEGSVYVFPSSVILHYDSDREEKERREYVKKKTNKRFKPGPNPNYIFDEVRLDIFCINSFNINGVLYGNEVKTSNSEIIDISIGSNFIKRYLGHMGQEHVFTTFSSIF